MARTGPSGTGTSILIRCINRLAGPTSGKIYPGGTKLTAGYGLSARQDIGRPIQMSGSASDFILDRPKS